MPNATLSIGVFAVSHARVIVSVARNIGVEPAATEAWGARRPRTFEHERQTAPGQSRLSTLPLPRHARARVFKAWRAPRRRRTVG